MLKRPTFVGLFLDFLEKIIYNYDNLFGVENIKFNMLRCAKGVITYE